MSYRAACKARKQRRTTLPHFFDINQFPFVVRFQFLAALGSFLLFREFCGLSRRLGTVVLNLDFLDIGLFVNLTFAGPSIVASSIVN